jgi:hypothetical protein
VRRRPAPPARWSGPRSGPDRSAGGGERACGVDEAAAAQPVDNTGQLRFGQAETITRREPANLHGIPRDSVVHFEREMVATGMWSAARERLTEAGPETTLWASENEYRFSGLPMRLVAPFMRGAFRKQLQQHMQDFKAFAEQGTDVREAKG